jgi:hypothetical protein
MPQTVDFHFVKSSAFRVVHCDGVWGGIAPTGLVHVSIFSERAPIPTRVTHALTEQGTFGPEIARHVESGLLREVEVDVVMNIEVAKFVRDWLGARIKEFDELQRILPSKQGTGH